MLVFVLNKHGKKHAPSMKNEGNPLCEKAQGISKYKKSSKPKATLSQPKSLDVKLNWVPFAER
jgi:hypothetical protein